MSAAATNRHLLAGVEVHGPPPTDAAVVVVAVHGRDQSPAYMVEHLVEPLAGPDVSWLLPAAADHTWYPGRFLAPIADNQPSLDHALEVLVDIERRLEGVDRRRVVWAGFSQGACLASEHLARRPARWGGLLAFTGGRIGPPGTALDVAGHFDGMPAYFGVGDHDDWVPEWRVRETADAYRAAGAEVVVEVFARHEHVIGDAEVERGRALLARVRRAGAG